MSGKMSVDRRRNDKLNGEEIFTFTPGVSGTPPTGYVKYENMRDIRGRKNSSRWAPEGRLIQVYGQDGYDKMIKKVNDEDTSKRFGTSGMLGALDFDSDDDDPGGGGAEDTSDGFRKAKRVRLSGASDSDLDDYTSDDGFDDPKKGRLVGDFKPTEPTEAPSPFIFGAMTDALGADSDGEYTGDGTPSDDDSRGGARRTTRKRRSRKSRRNVTRRGGKKSRRSMKPRRRMKSCLTTRRRR